MLVIVMQIDVLKRGDLLAEGFRCFRIRGLLALHRVNDDVMQQLEFVLIVVLPGLDSLGEEVVGRFINDLLGVTLLVVDPAHELLVVLRGELLLLRKFADLAGGLGDGFHVLFQFAELEFIAVDAAGHLAVGVGGNRRCEGEKKR